jgi:CRP-like cAMP-binding protein
MTDKNHDQGTEPNAVSTFEALCRKYPQLLVQLKPFAQHFKKDSFLFHQDEDARYLYYIQQGSVWVGTHLNDKEIITFTLLPGEILGEQILLESGQHKTFALVAEDSVISVIPASVWSDMSHHYPEMNILLMQVLLKRQEDVQQRLESVIFKDTKTRIIDYLIKSLEERGEKSGNHYVIPHMPTHQGIANWVSTSRQTVTIFLNELKEQSVIDFDRKNMIIYDLDKLKSFLN